MPRIRNLRDHPSPYVTTSELAEYWQVSRKQIYKQIDAGTLKAIRLGPRLFRISREDALEFEHASKMNPPSDMPQREEIRAVAFDHTAHDDGVMHQTKRHR